MVCIPAAVAWLGLRFSAGNVLPINVSGQAGCPCRELQQPGEDGLLPIGGEIWENNGISMTSTRPIERPTSTPCETRFGSSVAVQVHPERRSVEDVAARKAMHADPVPLVLVSITVPNRAVAQPRLGLPLEQSEVSPAPLLGVSPKRGKQMEDKKLEGPRRLAPDQYDGGQVALAAARYPQAAFGKHH